MRALTLARRPERSPLSFDQSRRAATTPPADFAVGAGAEDDCAAGVEDFDRIAGRDTAGLRVVRVHLENAGAGGLHALVRGLVGEGRVHVVVGLTGEEFEREVGVRGVARFDRCVKIGHRQELTLAAGRAEPRGRRERQRLARGIDGKRQRHVAFALQALAGDAGEARVLRIKSLVDEIVDGIGETGLIEAHHSSEGAEQRDVVADLAERRDGPVR